MSKPQTLASQSELPSPPRDPGCILFVLVFFLLFSACYVWTATGILDVDDIPSVPTKLTEYQTVFNDSARRSVDRDKVFGLAFSDETWSTVYFDLGSSEFDWIFEYDADGETTTQFPAVPVLEWLDTGIGGEGFVPLLNALLMVLALATLTMAVLKWFGWAAGAICLIFVLLDPTLFQSCFYRTHDGAVAALIVMSCSLVCLGMNRVDPSQRVIWKFVIAGMLLGATTLYQFQQSLWLIILIPAWVCFLIFKIVRRKEIGSFAEGSLLFTIGLLVVASPWWMRNCKTTGQSKMLGNSVNSLLLGAYSDAATASQGDLNFKEIIDRRFAEMEPLEFSEMDLLEKEEQFADYSYEQASIWASENPEAVQFLMINRVRNHLGLGNNSFDQNWPLDFHHWIAIGGIVGCLLCWRRLGMIVLPLVIASILVTAITWSDSGRFFIPLRPLLYATCAGSVGSVLIRLRGKKNSPSENETLPAS